MRSQHPVQGPAGPWTPSRKLAVVLELIQEKDTLAFLAHSNGISVQTLLAWRSAYFHEAMTPAQTPAQGRVPQLLKEIRRLKAALKKN
jgi:transposase-like protein